MPATTAALAKLQQRFTTPSIEEIQKYSPCAICWAPYDEGVMSDKPIKLPCRHVFGEKCLLKWAQGKTPSGYRNGCPLCHADLLPQTLWTRIWSSVQRKIEEDIIYFEAHPPTVPGIYGGHTTQKIFVSLCIGLLGIYMVSDELHPTPLVEALGLVVLAFTSYRGVRVYGLVFGFGFGILWGMLIVITFTVLGAIPLLPFKALKGLVLEMAGLDMSESAAM